MYGKLNLKTPIPKGGYFELKDVEVDPAGKATLAVVIFILILVRKPQQPTRHLRDDASSSKVDAKVKDEKRPRQRPRKTRNCQNSRIILS